MRKGFALPLILAIVVVVLIVVGAIAYFQFKPKLLPQTQLPEVTQSIPTPVPSPSDETTNWKTYRNENSGVTIKYPTRLSVQESNDPVNDVYMASFYAKSSVQPVFSTRIFHTTVSHSGKSPDEFLKEVAEEKLGQSSISRFVGFHDGGFEVEIATPSFSRHFFRYNDKPWTLIIEFVEGQNGFFKSSEFLAILYNTSVPRPVIMF